MITTTNTSNTNDTMLLKLVKNMVHLGKYTDGELLTAVTRVTTDPVGACEWSENVLKTVKHVDGPKLKNNVKYVSLSSL